MTDWGGAMFWKILGAVLLVWLLFAVVGFIIKGVFWLVTAIVIVGGIVLLVKVFSDSDNSPRPR